MYKIFNVTAIAALAFMLIACGKGRSQKQFTELSDFEGAKIASINGSVLDRFIDAVIPNVKHKYFNTQPELVAALSAGKVDAISRDMPLAKYLVEFNKDLVIFPDVLAEDRYGFAVQKNSELGMKANEILLKLKKEGTIRQLEEIWFSADQSRNFLPKFDYDGSAGTIKYGCDASRVPMSYIDSDGQPTGFELDIISRIAHEMNMKLEFIPMNFDGLLPALASGKADMVGGCMSITQERLQSVDFVGPYYEGGAVLIIKKERLGK